MHTKVKKMNSSNVAHEILFKEGYTSSESFIRDSALIIALSKIDQYKAECDSYMGKYGLEMEKFKAVLHKDKGTENFEKEEDLEDWEFAVQAVRWWQEKADELRSPEAA
jgi:hypothetical protein